MSSSAAILNGNTSAAQALSGTAVKADTSTTSSSSSTISSSDFLTLLVTELKNQDPTASTDPNEYVNQLVAVNSLEQLITINSTLTSKLGSSTTTTKSSSTANAAAADSTTASDTAQANASSGNSSTANAIQTATSKLAPGNLSVPAANASAQTVAQALSGQRKTL